MSADERPLLLLRCALDKHAESRAARATLAILDEDGFSVLLQVLSDVELGGVEAMNEFMTALLVQSADALEGRLDLAGLRGLADRAALRAVNDHPKRSA